jgi:hypothetical protein
MGGLIKAELYQPLADRRPPMYEECHRAQRYAFIATAELLKYPSGVRRASFVELTDYGCYFAMRDPFSKGASLLVKIRKQTEFFECQATVVHSTFGTGMAVEFREVSPPFLNVLQGWLLSVLHESRIELPS